MVTKKVCTVLLVDVSPTMHKHLASVGDNLSRIVQNKASAVVVAFVSRGLQNLKKRKRMNHNRLPFPLSLADESPFSLPYTRRADYVQQD